MDALEALQQAARERERLPELVDDFERIVRQAADPDEMLLFETGTFSFTGEPRFYFSLVRQTPDDDEEYFQLRMDVIYAPKEGDRAFSRAVWDADVEGDFFAFVRASAEYQALLEREIFRVSVSLEGT